MRIYLILIIAALSLACERAIDYKIPEQPSRFSVDARILTGERLQVFVAKSEYSLGNTSPAVVSDASVVLLENEQEVAVFQWISNAPDIGYYYSPFRPRPGQSYRVEVSNDELGLASGEDISLSPVNITGWEVDSSNLTLSISFLDPADTADFYAVRAYLKNEDREFPLLLGTTDPSVDFFYDFSDGIFGDNFKTGYAAFLSDQTFAGATKTVKFEEVFFADDLGGLPESLILEVTRISEEYYRHESTKGAQYTGGDNPFAEPVQIYSNIENGYGIVAVGAPTRVEIKF